MNHRQWKKKFKKVHGRAPYPQEDKRVKSELTRSELEEMCEVIASIPKILAEILADATQALSDMFANIADALRRY
jgi:hypothetical protein